METNRKIIIALIAVVVIFLAGIIAIAPNYSNQNQTAYQIPLKNQDFGYLEMPVPVGSNFTLINNKTEIGKGMSYWKNTGNFSNETDGLMVSINQTDSLIGQNVKLISTNNTEKVYVVEESSLDDYFKVVKTINGTDVIVTGNNLQLIREMLNSTKIKDTSKLTLKNSTASKVEKTPVEQVIEQKKEENVEKVVGKNETTVVEKNETVVVEKNETAVVEKNETVVVKNETKEPLMIGGGAFTTGSDDADKTYARIYLGVDHAGETVKMKIFYSRDGNSLNNGNLVTATIDENGYVNIASADAYKYYPDFARIEVYDDSGAIITSQGVYLNPTSGTQYF